MLPFANGAIVVKIGIASRFLHTRINCCNCEHIYDKLASFIISTEPTFMITRDAKISAFSMSLIAPAIVRPDLHRPICLMPPPVYQTFIQKMF